MGAKHKHGERQEEHRETRMRQKWTGRDIKKAERQRKT